jgi:hypothetical protein
MAGLNFADKSLMIWDITPKKDTEDEQWGVPRRVLKGISKT